MAINIFLGYPPENIKTWIINNCGSKENADNDLLCFSINNPDEESTISLKYFVDEEETDEPIKVSLLYSDNGAIDWKPWNGDPITLNSCKDGKVFIKANQPNDANFANYEEYINHTFIMTGKINASGNIQYLLTSDGKRTDIPNDCFF